MNSFFHLTSLLVFPSVITRITQYTTKYNLVSIKYLHLRTGELFKQSNHTNKKITINVVAMSQCVNMPRRQVKRFLKIE